MKYGRPGRVCELHHRRSPQGERGLKLDYNKQELYHYMSLSARRAWIEMDPRQDNRTRTITSRSPQGERGLKCWCTSHHPKRDASLSARRAWIEIRLTPTPLRKRGSLSARRAWIEIVAGSGGVTTHRRRSPQGERGLKSVGPCSGVVGFMSLSARRAWIEIGSCTHIRRGQPRRSPQGERGLKFGGVPPGEVFKRRSPQGERGLKLSKTRPKAAPPKVALRKESVD